MRQPTRGVGPALFSFGLGLFAFAAIGAAPAQNPSLAGSWKLNEEKSDRPEDKLREASKGDNLPALPEGRTRAGRGGVGGAGRTAPSAGGSGDPTTGGGAGAAAGRGARGEGGGGGRANLGPLMLYIRPLAQLVVDQNDSTITISDPSGTPRTYRADGRKVTEDMLNGEQLEITAKWKGGKLQIERKLGSLGTLKESYSMDPASKQLVVDVSVSGAQLPRTVDLHRVYDPAGGGK